MKDKVVLGIGAATFAVAEIAWAAAHGFHGQKGLWIMKTGMGIGVAFAAFVAVATMASARYPAGSGISKCVLNMTGGGIVAMVVALFAVGAGNLWPIVIVFDGAILAVAALVGAAVGAAFRREQAS